MHKTKYAVFAAGLALGLLFSTADASAQGFGYNRIRVFGPDRNEQPVVKTPSNHFQFNFHDEDGDGICDSFDELNDAHGFNGIGRYDDDGDDHGFNGIGRDHDDDDDHDGYDNDDDDDHDGDDHDGRGRHHGDSDHFRNENWRHGDSDHFRNIDSPARNHFGPLLEDGQIQLTATVTDVQELLFSVLNGAFVIDASEADLQYIHWFSSDDSNQLITIEAGQRVSLVGEIIETADGAVIKALIVRVMDEVHNVLEEDEGIIRGVVNSIDFGAGELVLSGIPVVIDETTLIRSRGTNNAELQPGNSAAVCVRLIDNDGDGLLDSLFAKSIIGLLNN